MLALVPPGQADAPNFLFLHMFLMRLDLDIRAHCVPFAATEPLEALARRADVKFFAKPTSSRLVMAASTGGLDPSADSELHAVANRRYCYIHERYGAKARTCRGISQNPCRWTGNGAAGRN